MLKQRLSKKSTRPSHTGVGHLICAPSGDATIAAQPMGHHKPRTEHNDIFNGES